MDIIKLATDLLSEKLGTDIEPTMITQALSSLLGGGDGKIDLSGLVSQMMGNSSLQSLASSWLGDSSNIGITPSSVMDLFGQDKISQFSSQLGIDTNTATQGLADVLPNLVDKASSGGSLLDSVGGAGGLMDMAKKFF